MNKIFTALVITLTLPPTTAVQEIQTYPNLLSKRDNVKKIRELSSLKPSRLSSSSFQDSVLGLNPQIESKSERKVRMTDVGLDEGEVSEFIKALMQCKQVPGLSVAVVKGNKSWTKGFGVKDLETGAPVNSSTLFGVGSLTKQFTATLLAMALEDVNRMGNNVTWKTRVKEVMQEDLVLVNHLEEKVTLEDILSHSTGLMAADIMTIADFPRTTRAEFIRRLRYLPQYRPYRQAFRYNNWINSLAGDVTEYLLADDWETLLEQRLLVPLNLDSQLIRGNDDVMSGKFARPYQMIKGEVTLLDFDIYNATQNKVTGALGASADDMVKWMRFLLDGGVLPSGERLLGEDKVKDMLTSHLHWDKNSDEIIGDDFDGYGFAWFTGSYHGKRTVSHPGGWFGYQSTILMFPEDDIGVFVSTSGPGTPIGVYTFRVLSYYLSDIILGYSPLMNLSTACAYENAIWIANVNDNDDSIGRKNLSIIENRHRYIGKYSHPLFGDVIIKNSTSFYGLVMKLQRLEGFLIPMDREFEYEVQHTGKTAYYSTNNFNIKTSRLSFSRHSVTSDGKCNTVVLRGPVPENTDKMEFKRND